MTASQKRALSAHRRRLKRRGLTRLEVKVHKRDAALIREIAHALANPALEGRTRTFLQKEFGETKPAGLKALLAAAPLDGIDLTRDRDLVRDLEL